MDRVVGISRRHQPVRIKHVRREFSLHVEVIGIHASNSAASFSLEFRIGQQKVMLSTHD